MNNENDLLIRISPESRQIMVESTDNGVKSVKEILPETFLECVKNSISRDKQRVVSGFLPQNCFHVSMCEDGARDYCIWHPRLRADISYYGTEYNDFPLPRLVFGVSVSPEGKIYNCRLGVVRDEPPRESTPMYVYPFSNVAGFGLCTGNNELPVYKNRSTLATLPDYLLRLPNNNDSFNARHNRLHLQHRDLLEHLKKKDPAYYYTDVLVSSGKTLPRLVFGFAYDTVSRKATDARLCVVKDERLTPVTRTYHYPFSNVYGNHNICLGKNELPTYKDPTRIATLADFILRMPNNNDMYSEDNNKLNLGYRDLLEHLKDKTPAYYYTDVLIPDGKTLKDFFEWR